VTNARIAELSKLLSQSNVGWLLEEYADQRLAQILEEIDELSSLLTSELRAPCEVLSEMGAEPGVLKPLIQLFATPTTTPMRAAAYCIIRGMDVKSIRLAYEHKLSLHLSITVEDVVTGETHAFSSSAVYDVEILRHMGIMTLSGKPILTGFYAFLD
jgi:hypothetical protein